MGLAVEVYFDPEAERAVFGVWEVVRAVSGSSLLFDLRTRPHVSLAAYPEGVKPLEDVLASFWAAPFPFALASAGAFPGAEGVVFLAPVVDAALLRLHRGWHALAPGGTAHYAPGAWVPHCTVGINLADVAPAVAAARAALPIRGRFESIALVEFDRELATPVRCLVERPFVTA